MKIRTFIFLLVSGLVFGSLSAGVLAQQPGLWARWPLAGSAEDDSGNGRHAVNHGVTLDARDPENAKRLAATFNGRDGFLEIPAGKAPQLGTGDFSIALRVNIDPVNDDLPGDLVTCYDAARRRGFNLGITSNAGVTTNQANFRNLHFGIDNDRIETQWTDHGRPGEALLIFALTVFKGSLYAGTCEPRAGQAGHVYRLDQEGRWIDLGSPHPCNSVSALAVHAGELYAGVSKYRVAGSSLPESENTHLGGKIYRYDGGQRWIDCGQLPATEAIGGLVVYRGKLYASSLYRPAGFFRYEGDQQWTALDVPDGKRVEAMAVYNGQLFATSYDLAHVYRYDGTSWTDCGQLGDEKNTQTYSFAVHWGKLYVGTWATGKVFRYEEDNRWTDVGRLGEELEVMGMAVHNGQLFAGTLPLAEVHRFDGKGAWLRVGRLDLTPDVKYRRAWTMAEARGRLFCGTLPEGRVKSLQAGRSVTFDDELPKGWRHIAAVRGGDRLRLYVDGREAAVSTPLRAEDFDLNGEAPLLIGFGPHDYLRGSLRDVSLHTRALSAAEISKLARE
jgi:Concanavalin A-like lectin/glucanases superfamily